MKAAPKPASKPENRSKTLEEIRHLNSVMNSLMEKREKLIGVQIKLDTFNLGADDFNTVLEIRDLSGNKFQTTNREIISKTIRMVDSEVKTQMVEVDSHLKSIFE